MTGPAVLVLNMQNDIVHPDGMIGSMGNAARVAARGVLANTAGLLTAARAAGVPVFFVGSGYDAQLSGLNRSVAQFAGPAENGGMRLGSWGARFHDDVAPAEGETVAYRPGIGIVADTPVAGLLASAERVYVAGVSTRLVVEAVVFELTDRGHAVTVVEDCCSAASDEQHADALAVLTRFALVAPVADVIADIVAEPTEG